MIEEEKKQLVFNNNLSCYTYQFIYRIEDTSKTNYFYLTYFIFYSDYFLQLESYEYIHCKHKHTLLLLTELSCQRKQNKTFEEFYIDVLL